MNGPERRAKYLELYSAQQRLQELDSEHAKLEHNIRQTRERVEQLRVQCNRVMLENSKEYEVVIRDGGDALIVQRGERYVAIQEAGAI